MPRKGPESKDAKAAGARAERLKAALRANLVRRKAQARTRAAGAGGEAATGASGGAAQRPDAGGGDGGQERGREWTRSG